MSYSAKQFHLVSVTQQLTSYVNHGLHEKALALFHQMQTSLFISLDAIVYPLALKSCAALRRIKLGSSIHGHCYKTRLLFNPFVASALVGMYGKCGSLLLARTLFDEIPQRNEVVWNAMIALYCRSGLVDDAQRLFNAMDVLPSRSSFHAMIAAFPAEDDGPLKAISYYREMRRRELNPNLITLLALLPPCIGLSTLRLIREIHGFSLRNGMDSNQQLRSGLVEAYGRTGCLSSAGCLFWSMKDKDVVAWSSMISASALHGGATSALDLFRQMELSGVRPDAICLLAVLKACSHAGLATDALDCFYRIQRLYKVQPNSDHYSCLIDVLSRAGMLYEAHKVISEMPVKATAKAWGALLGACRTYEAVELAEIAGRALLELEPQNHGNYVSLGKVLSSVGRYEEAQRLRGKMEQKCIKIGAGSTWLAK